MSKIVKAMTPFAQRVLERRLRVYAMRIDGGMTFQEIGRTLGGVTAGRARQIFMAAHRIVRDERLRIPVPPPPVMAQAEQAPMPEAQPAAPQPAPETPPPPAAPADMSPAMLAGG